MRWWRERLDGDPSVDASPADHLFGETGARWETSNPDRHKMAITQLRTREVHSRDVYRIVLVSCKLISNRS